MASSDEVTTGLNAKDDKQYAKRLEMSTFMAVQS
jgi:hypothetical protein